MTICSTCCKYDKKSPHANRSRVLNTDVLDDLEGSITKILDQEADEEVETIALSATDLKYTFDTHSLEMISRLICSPSSPSPSLLFISIVVLRWSDMSKRSLRCNFTLCVDHSPASA